MPKPDAGELGRLRGEIAALKKRDRERIRMIVGLRNQLEDALGIIQQLQATLSRRAVQWRDEAK